MKSRRPSPGRIVSSLGLLLLLAAGPAAALDPHKSITQYVHQVWRTENGLPQNSIQTILQTRDGYIWLGTERGLVRFDGVRFTVFDKGNTRGLGNSNVQALHEDRAGRLWIGTWGGLHLREGGRYRAFTTRSGLSSNRVLSLCEDRDGDLWIGTGGGGLDRWKNGTLEAVPGTNALAKLSIWSLAEGRDGTLWIGTDGAGLGALREGVLRMYTASDGLPGDIVQALLVDRGGNLWIGTDGGGLARYREGRFTTWKKAQGLPSDTVESIHEDRDGNLWVGTRGGGLSRLADGLLTSFSPAEGLSDDTVLSIFEDREASLWLGTVTGGLNRLKDGKFTAYTRKEGLPSDRVRTIYEDGSGAIWFGTRGAGVSRLSNGRFTSFSSIEGLAGDFVRSIAEDGSGHLWVGTWGDGLSRLEGGARFRAFHRRDGLPSEIVRSMYRDRSGALWIGTDAGGLVSVHGEAFTVYGPREGLKDTTVLAIREDDRGDLWLGTEGGGLYRLSKGRFQSFSTADGLSDDTVLSLYGDADGCLWIGTDGGGLNRYRDGKFTRVTRRQGLFDDVQYAILEDGRGDLWMSCSRGIYRTRRSELEDVAEGRRASVTSTAFGRADGMRSAECSGFTQPAAWKSKDGRLWFPTIDGAVVIDPDRIRSNAEPPPVVIEEAIVDHRALVAGSDGLRAPPGRGDLEIHYAGLSFIDPERVHFRYKLEGFDPEWIEAGSRRVAYYTNIPPGPYRFRVLACNNDGVWNQTGADLEFSLTPHFYQTRWFYTLGGIALALAIFGAGRVRAARAKARETALEAQVAERTLELERVNEQLQKLSVLDPLTGIPNRRRFAEALDGEWRRAFRDRLPLSLIMIDIDHFKDFNDACGHQAGDDCLRQVASAIREALTRPGDLVARWGGEEFAAVLPSTPWRGAAAVAEVLRARIESMRIRHPRAAGGVVTLSLGVATAIPEDDSSPDSLVAAADEALYRAKRAGRNRIETAEQSAARASSAQS